ncbi:MAG: amidohydrolase, partial [bacterium]
MRYLFLFVLLSFQLACESRQEADLVLLNGKVFTYTWSDPAGDGTPAVDAPYQNGILQPDAEAIALRDGKTLIAGSRNDVEQYIAETTQVIDVQGGAVIPGLVDSHTHVAGLGAKLERVDLTDAKNEMAAVALVAARAKETPAGEWIIGQGWDEGAWASNYPDKKLLTAKAPDHPVLMQSLHGFAAWGNQMALDRAGIDASTKSPVGGEIRKDANGNPTGLFLNRATNLLTSAVPAPTHEQIKKRLLAGLQEMARSGYVMVHEAGVDSEHLKALQELQAEGKLPIRVYAMLSARDEPLIRDWIARSAWQSDDNMLFVRSVKAYYDGALGSRGARLLEAYSDKPGHFGISGEGYGFNQEIVAEIMKAGFQAGVHAIGDAGNRETLNFFEKVFAEIPEARRNRHRIEHAQVLHPDDFARFKELQIIASMEPPHAVEDKTWAEDRLGPQRIKHAY